MLPFAQANGSGSVYALWRVDDREDLGALPVVVLGSEGGFHVVARNLAELLQLLGFDAEIAVDWNDAYMIRVEGLDEPAVAMTPTSRGSIASSA